MVAILRSAKTPAGTEVRTVIKHVTRRIRTHWPKTRLVWRGDSHYGRYEAMEWAENNDADYIFGLAGNSVLDALVADTADNLRLRHAWSTEPKLRWYTSVEYQAGSWSHPRRVVARLEVSMQPDPKAKGCMRQEVDIRYVVTSLEGDPRHLYENVYCQRGQMENLAGSTGVEQGQAHRTKAAVAARARVVDPGQVAFGASHARLDAVQPGGRQQVEGLRSRRAPGR